MDEFRIYYQSPIKTILLHPEYLPDLINKAFDRATQSASDVMQEMEQDGQIEQEGEIFVGEDLLASLVKKK